MASWIAINIFNWFQVGRGLHYFILEDELITVKNSWMPWVKKTYNLSDVKSMKICRNLTWGKTLAIITVKGEKRWVTNVDKDMLNEMIKIYEKYLTSPR